MKIFILGIKVVLSKHSIYDAENWNHEGNHESLNFEFGIRLRKIAICMEMT